MENLGIIGFGTMGEAFVLGLRQRPLRIRVFDVKQDKVSGARGAYDLVAEKSASAVVESSEITILCVKPQDLAGLLPEIRQSAKGKRFISILAGKRIDTIAEGLSTTQVARFMPNLAAVVGASMIGISFHEGCAADFRKDSLAIAGALGTPMELPERLLAAMTGVSGSGIAYVFAFVHALSLGGVAAGFDYRTALKAAIGTLEGAAKLLGEGTHPMELASRVISPAGTTIQGVRALERGGFTASVMEAVEAASRRAQELEG